MTTQPEVQTKTLTMQGPANERTITVHWIADQDAWIDWPPVHLDLSGSGRVTIKEDKVLAGIFTEVDLPDAGRVPMEVGSAWKAARLVDSVEDLTPGCYVIVDDSTGDSWTCTNDGREPKPWAPPRKRRTGRRGQWYPDVRPACPIRIDEAAEAGSVQQYPVWEGAVSDNR